MTRMSRRFARFVAIGLFGSVSLAAGAQTTIDFDALSGMPNLGLTVPGASQLGNGLQATTGATFASSSGVPYVAVVNLGAGHATSGTNGIGGVNGGGILDYSVAIEVSFSIPGSPNRRAVTGSVSIRGDQLNGAGSATLTAFDAAGTQIGSTTTADIAGGLTLSLSASGIHRVRITTTEPTIALDDLTFGVLVPAPPVSVPTLGDAALALLALLLAAASMRAIA